MTATPGAEPIADPIKQAARAIANAQNKVAGVRTCWIWSDCMPEAYDGKPRDP